GWVRYGPIGAVVWKWKLTWLLQVIKGDDLK
ncbi:unnamed protein product, partial [marine sediment metagenome]